MIERRLTLKAALKASERRIAELESQLAEMAAMLVEAEFGTSQWQKNN